MKRNRLTALAGLLLLALTATVYTGCSNSTPSPAPTDTTKLPTPTPSSGDAARGLNYNGFSILTGVSTSEGSYLPGMWQMWKDQQWNALDSFITKNKLNYGYPPAQGFVNVDTVTLAVGTKLDRYGYSGGRFVAPQGAPFPERSLPNSALKKPYHTYQVIKAIPNVLVGKSIPWFGQPGMGTQYMFSDSVGGLVRDKYLVLTDSVLVKK